MFRINKNTVLPRPILYVDMDGVLVDFNSGINRLSKKVYQTFAPDDFDKVPGIFSLMDPVPGSIEAIQRLSDFFDIYILSTAPWDNPSAWGDKLNWVKLYLGEDFRKKLILCHHKDLLIGKYLIDDRDKNGSSEFTGEWIHFGQGPFPDWKAVENYLMGKL